MKQNAVVFNLLDNRLAAADAYVKSLRDPALGHFTGDIWAISRSLSGRVKNWLDSIGVKYLVFPQEYLFERRREWERIAKAQSRYKNPGEADKRKSPQELLRLAFYSFVDQKYAKLLFLPWFERFGHQYQSVIFSNNDILVQKPLEELFDQQRKNPDVIWHSNNLDPAVPNTTTWRKDLANVGAREIASLDLPLKVINSGLLLGQPKNLAEVFKIIQNNFLKLNVYLFEWDAAGEDVLLRFAQARYPEKFAALPEDMVFNVTPDMERYIFEDRPLHYLTQNQKQEPHWVSFCGNPQFSPLYNKIWCTDSNSFLVVQETRAPYDGVRDKSVWDILQFPSKYRTPRNLETQKTARRHWMANRSPEKNNLMIIGNFGAASHVSLYQKISVFINNDVFNTVIINNNSDQIKIDHPNWEETPDILSGITRFKGDTHVATCFGYRLAYIPEKAVAHSIECLQTEYDCTERVARAFANLAYLYYKNLFLFYRPNVVGFPINGPLFRVVKELCLDLKIPFFDTEWGVLDGTCAFGFCGPLGESWSARYSDFFNALPVEEIDLKEAEQWLDLAKSGQYSRNRPLSKTIPELEAIKALKESGKKILVIFGDNNAHSGSCPWDERGRTLYSPLYKNQAELLTDFSQALSPRKDIHIIYKPHPIAKTRYLDVPTDLPNVTICLEGIAFNYLDICDLAVVNISQSAYEALSHNVPVLLTGRLQLTDSGAVYVLNDRQDISDLVAQSLKEGFTKTQQDRFKEHCARQLRYALYAHNAFPFGRPQERMAEDIDAIMRGSQEPFLKYEREAYLNVLGSGRPEPVMSANPAISVVIPFYNAEEFLNSCLRSLVEQTLPDFEVFCVDNGSTDSSPQIINYWAEQDPRIKLITLDEPNLPLARNTGAKLAQGKYLYFMDADDDIDPITFKTLFDIMEQYDPEALYFGYRPAHPTRNQDRARTREFSNFFPEESLRQLAPDDIKYMFLLPFPWSKIYNREFFEAHELYYNEDCKIYNDDSQNVHTLAVATKIYFLNKALYSFRRYDTSWTKGRSDRFFDALAAIKHMNAVLENNAKYHKYAEVFIPFKTHTLLYSWRNLPDNRKQEFHEGVKALFPEGDENFFYSDSAACYNANVSIGERSQITGMMAKPYTPPQPKSKWRKLRRKIFKKLGLTRPKN